MTSPPKSPLRRLALPIYVPTLLIAAAQEAVTPFIVLSARGVGASVAGAAMIYALRGLAGMLCNLPAGWLIARLGERITMILAPTIMAVAAIGCVFASDSYTFGFSILGLGAGWSIWKVARLSLLTSVVPPEMRGRALASLGGITRVGHFAGPALVLGAVSLLGLDGAFALYGVLCGLSIGGLLWLRSSSDAERESDGQTMGYLQLARTNGATLRTSGVAVLIIAALRHSRQVVIPLWGESVGLDVGDIALIFAISAAVEMLLFYPAGRIMDRWGRKGTTLRCGVSMAATYLLLPLAFSFPTVLAVTLLSAIGNGLASGIVMVLGSDVAPITGRARFLALWNLMFDVGSSSGPIAFSLVGAVTSLQGAALILGVLGLAGSLFIGFRMPETGGADPRIA